MILLQDGAEQILRRQPRSQRQMKGSDGGTGGSLIGFKKRIEDDGGLVIAPTCAREELADFAMIPLAYKAGKLYSQKRIVLPTDVGYPLSVDDFVFIRNSKKRVRGLDGLQKELAVNIPGFQWDVGDTCPYILTENQSTNLLEWSNTFQDNNWIKAEVSIAAYSDIAPDGMLRATTVTPNVLGGDTTTGDGSTNNRMFRDIGAANNEFTSSLWVKSKSGSSFLLSLHIQNSASDAKIAHTTVTVTNTWQRIKVTGTTVGVVTGNRFTIQTEQAVLIWEGQSEVGSLMTSNITTEVASVTRLKDLINGSADATSINSEAGSMIVESASLVNDLTTRYFSLSDGTRANRIAIYYTKLNTIAVIMTIASVTQAFHEEVVTSTLDNHKIVFTWALNNFALWVDGVKVYTDLIGSTFAPNVLTGAQMSDGDDAFAEGFVGKVKGFKVYKRVLTNTEIQNL